MKQKLIKSFQERLKKLAGFEYVPEPMAMRNQMRSTVYYLFFAGPNQTGSGIAEDIFNGYRKRGYGQR